MGAQIPGITKLVEEVFEGKGDHVVMLDGIAHDGRDMRKLGRFLHAAGYRAVTLGYPSTRLPIEKLASEYIPSRMQHLVPDDGRPIHFVTHSMGGIVLRKMLHTVGLPRMGRAVMIAPPNHGSPVVDVLRHFSPFRWYFGPSGLQLGTCRESVPLALPPADFDVGVLAGDVSFDPWFNGMFEGPHDGKVSVASTRLEGMSDFRILPYSHYFIHRRHAVHTLALNYLQHGRFDPHG